jgi:hypothetical protein
MESISIPSTLCILAQDIETYARFDKGKITPENSTLVSMEGTGIIPESKVYFLKEKEKVILECDVHKCIHCKGMFLYELADAGLIEEVDDHNSGRTCPECIRTLIALLARPRVEEALAGKTHFTAGVEDEKKEKEEKASGKSKRKRKE